MTATAIKPRKALTIRQPWASLIMEGYKLVENRVWDTRYRGTLAIHAGLKTDVHDRDALRDEFGLTAPYPTGYLGTVDLVDVHWSAGICCGIWAQENVYHWRFDNPRPLLEPIPARGMQGLFTAPTDINWGQR